MGTHVMDTKWISDANILVFVNAFNFRSNSVIKNLLK